MAVTSSNCKICLNNFANSVILSCSHPICHQCIKSVCFQHSVVCPVCWKMTYLQNNSESPLHLSSNSTICSSSSASKIDRSLHSRYESYDDVTPMNNLVIQVENGSLKVEMLKMRAVEMKEEYMDRIENAVEEKVIHCEDSSNIKNENVMEMEIVNGRLKLKPLKDRFVKKVESVSQLEDLNLSVSNKEKPLNNLIANETPNEENGAKNSANKGKIDNLSTTEETGVEQKKNLQKKGSNERPISLGPVCKLSIGNKSFIPKFGTHLSLPKTYKVKITSVVNPYRIYIQILDDDLLRLEVLNKRLQVTFNLATQESTEISAIKNPLEGCACAVFYECSWHRGMVKKHEANGKVPVMLVDTGLTCLVRPLCVQPLPESFFDLPAQAVRCKLADILRFELKGKKNRASQVFRRYWPIQVMDLIERKENQLAKIFVSDFLSGSVGITSSTMEATVFAKMIVDGEHTSLNQQIDETNELVLQKFFCSSSKKLIDKETESVLVEHSISTRNSTETRSSPTTRARSKRNCQLNDNKKCLRKHTAQWNFSDPKTTLPEFFNGVVTWIDDSGGFFVHNSIWSKQLILIRETLNASFNRTELLICDNRCRPENPCLAKYHDNWYRAVVKFVKKNLNTALVFLVDYGATVEVDLCDIRMDVILTQVPVQTFRCTLHNMMPPEVKKFDAVAIWPENLIDSLHTAAVNQEFSMTVKSYSPLRIGMRFLKNLMDLTDFLAATRKGEHIVKK